MKKLVLTSIFAFMFVLLGVETTHAMIDPNNITTVTCYDTCNPNFTTYIGTVILDLQCDATSPGSYTGSLTVNGVSLSYTADCGPALTFGTTATIDEGESTDLTWSTANADSCSASGDWSGAKSTTTNTESVSPIVTSQYTMTCFNASGDTERTVAITVIPKLIVTVSNNTGPVANIGEEVIWTAKIEGGQQPYSNYSWTGDVPLGSGTSITSPVIGSVVSRYYTSIGTKNVQFTAEDSRGNVATDDGAVTMEDNREPQ